jgi:predicted DNA-binding transcriptional regulator YafY
VDSILLTICLSFMIPEAYRQVHSRIAPFEKQLLEVRSEGSETRSRPVKVRSEGPETRSCPVEVRSEGSETRSRPAEVRSEGSETRSRPVEVPSKGLETRSCPVEVRSEGSETRSRPVEVRRVSSKTCSCPVEVRSCPLGVRREGSEIRRWLAEVRGEGFEIRKRRAAGLRSEVAIRETGAASLRVAAAIHETAASSRRIGGATPIASRTNRRPPGVTSNHSVRVRRALASTSMGRRNHAETMIAIVDAFHEKNTWTQAALAERVGVEARSVRAVLDVLVETKRFPLERMREGAHVYWSLPKRWVAGGVALPEEDIAPLARLVARSPRGTFRNRMLATLLACAPPRVPRPVEPDTMDGTERSDFEERMLSLVESSAAQHIVVSVRYITASRGEESSRALSVQRIDARPPARLVAYCHKAKELRTFRVDRLRGAVIDRGVAFVRVDEHEVAAYVARSVDGFHGFGDNVEVSKFFVRDPEARWVQHNLLAPMRFVAVDGGIEVTVKSASVEPVARFVVGLGGAAVVSTPALRAAVRALAEGALRAGEV